ncbi:DNA-3-methyladenine glycosylase I [Methylosinus sp. Ce-a6]|uniref:DNA-3-methyladenine glycosylase I n=1 Tax=Methylosinus sp. Ce-a6 TaxID=2172005 RepID=UPI00210F3E9F|nr:DNA-3-methyladenine glycosylase I [Methylosinus sp. Ce-a6]
MELRDAGEDHFPLPHERAPARCAAMSEPEFDRLLANKTIVRNGAKISAVRENAQWILELAREHGSAARFFSEWPDDRNVELLDLMKRKGSRLGGETGMRLLRALGKPAFVLTKDVIAALAREGVIASPPTSKAQMNAIQMAMNQWSSETGLDLTALSRYLAWSIGTGAAAPVDARR